MNPTVGDTTFQTTVTTTGEETPELDGPGRQFPSNFVAIEKRTETETDITITFAHPPNLHKT